MKKLFYFSGMIVLLVMVGLVFLFIRKPKPPEVINLETPLALEVTKVRSYYHALGIQNRLQDMGLRPYLVTLDDSVKGGKWYKVLVGAKKDTIELEKLRKELEAKYQFKQLEVVNYQSAKDKLVDVMKETITEQKKINTKKPDIPQPVYDVISKFPNSNIFFVEKLFVFYTPKSSRQRQFFTTILKNHDINTDLPRGIDLSMIWGKADAFAEAIYTDNIFGDRITIDILKLKPKQDTTKQVRQANFFPISLATESLQQIADEFADKILDTGEYLTEEKIPITVLTQIGVFQGYKVVIEPKKDQRRTYLVLVDEGNEYLVFCQSTDKGDDELFKILKEIGRGSGMIDYGEFYNNFFTLPDSLPDKDVFLGFFIYKLDWSYAKQKDYEKWAKEMVGHWTATGIFYNPLNGGWTCTLFDLLTQEKADYIEDLYKKSINERINVIIKGVDGTFCTNLFGLPYEVNFTKSRYACAVDNSFFSIFSDGNYLNKEQLIFRAEAFQLGEEPTIAQADSTVM